jgi:hypothetical protein
MKTLLALSVGVAVTAATAAAQAQAGTGTSWHEITVRRHSTVTLSNATVDTMFTNATNRMTNDNDGTGTRDVQCALGWGRSGNVTSFTNTDGDISTDAEVNTMLNSVNGYAKVVDTITRCGTTGTYRGCGGVGSLNGYIVTDTAPDDSWAHEFGHNVGLGHVTTDTQRIMASGATNRQRVTAAECTAYQRLVDVDGPGGGTTQGDSVEHVAADFSNVPIEEVAQYGFIDTVPIEVREYYGAEDVEILRQMLADPDQAVHRPNIIALLGLLSDGSDSDADTITAYLNDRSDEVVASASISLGYVAQRGRGMKALNKLLARSEHANKQTAEFAIQGLGVSGRPQALAQLRRLAAQAEAADESPSVAAASAGGSNGRSDLLKQSIDDAQLIGWVGLEDYYQQ